MISIHTLLAESDKVTELEKLSRVISIHTLLAESDHDFCKSCKLTMEISIHTLLAESDML